MFCFCDFTDILFPCLPYRDGYNDFNTFYMQVMVTSILVVFNHEIYGAYFILILLRFV